VGGRRVCKILLNGRARALVKKEMAEKKKKYVPVFAASV
jgi:hypothetical protein